MNLNNSIKLTALGALAAASAFYAASALATQAPDRADLVMDFVASRPAPSRMISFAPHAATEISIGDPLDLKINVTSGGYVAAILISQNGEVTYVGGVETATVGFQSIWDAVGVDTPKAGAPWGYDLCIVMLDVKKPWAEEKRKPEFLSADPKSPKFAEELAAIQGKFKDRAWAASAFHTYFTKPASTRDLAGMEKPAKPIWIIGVQGQSAEPQ